MSTPPSFNNPLISLLGIVINVAIIPIAPMITGKKNEGKIGIFKNIPAPANKPQINDTYKYLYILKHSVFILYK